jgi:hypothetical protein
MPTPLQPGDVAVVRSPLTWTGLLIRAGSMLHGQAPVDHVAIVREVMADGEVELIEGRPSGVGREVLSHYHLVSDNRDQPKTDAQRKQVIAAAEMAVDTPYDWWAIVVDAAGCLWLPQPTSADYPTDRPPGTVVCSSLGSWAYRTAGLPEPVGKDRWCQPWHWQRWCTRREWEQAG